MKYIDNLPELELLSQALSFQSPSIKVTTRIEAYTCKPVSREKKLLKTLDQEFQSDIELSASVSPPEHQSNLDSAFGPLDKRQNRKTLWLLISTLNLAFPDFDFSSVPPDSFAREQSASSVLGSLSNALNHLRSSAGSSSSSLYRSFSSYTGLPHPQTAADPAVPTHPFLQRILDPIIGLGECDVYSYAPDVESDPYAAESEFGSTVPSEVDEEEVRLGNGTVATPGQEEEMWPMEGFPPSPAPAASHSTPSTPLATHARKLRSGKSYLTGATSFANFRHPLRSRSQTPMLVGEESSTGGFLWSCNYFFYNKAKKRMLFISHHMKRPQTSAAPPYGLENVNTFDQHFKTPRSSASRMMHKRRGSANSLLGSGGEGLVRKRLRSVV